jgi:hypothetical protein
MVAEWLSEVYSNTNMPVETGKNSWKKAEFEWFLMVFNGFYLIITLTPILCHQYYHPLIST